MILFSTLFSPTRASNDLAQGQPLRWLVQRWQWLIGLAILAWSVSYFPIWVVAAAAIALIGIPLLVRFPWLILPLFALLLPMSGSYKIGAISASDGLLAIAFSLWFADGVRRRTLTISGSVPIIAALLYAFFLFVALFNAYNFAEAAAEMLKWVEFAVVVLLAQAMLVNRERQSWLVLGLLTGGVLQGLLGVYQFVFRIGPEWFIFLGRFMRAYGSFSQPNPYAGYLGLTLPVAVSLALFGLRWVHRWEIRELFRQNIMRQPIFWGVVGTLSALVIGTGIVLSWSRGGWLGMVAGLMVVLFLRSRRMLAQGMAALLFVVIFALAGTITPTLVPEAIASRVADLPAYFGLTDILSQPLSDENFAVVERVAHWAAALRMWRLSPWIGVGPGNYAVVYNSVKIPGWDEALGHAHNIYLNVLAETGIWGLIAFLGMWAAITLWVIRQLLRAKTQQDGWRQSLLLGILGIITHLMIHNIFDNLFVQGMYLHLALWIGVVANRSDGEIL